MRFDDRITGIALWALALFVIVMSWQIPSVPGTTFGPDLFPILIGTGFILTGTIIFLKGWRSAGNGPWIDLSDWHAHARGLIGSAWTIGGIIVAIMYFDEIGFPLFSLGYALPMMFLMGARPLPAIMVSVTSVAIAYLVFARIMFVPLPVGPLLFLR